MPTAAEIRERADQIAGRVHSFTNQSMQQVRRLALRSSDYVRVKLTAFNNTCRGRKNPSDAQNWSTSTSDRNSHRGSRKNLKKK